MKLPIDANIIRLELLLLQGKSFPLWELNIPYTIVNDEVVDADCKRMTIDAIIDLNVSKIEITNKGKSITDTVLDASGNIVKNQQLKIEKMLVNNILLEPWIIDQYSTFIPNYTQSELNYASTALGDILHTTSLYYNGVWTFPIIQPFFIWYNTILINSLGDINKWVQQSHLGIVEQSTLDKLNLLLDQL